MMDYGGDLQYALEWCAARMTLSIFKSEVMILSRERVECSLQVRDESLSQVEEFKYLRMLLTSEEE